MAREIPIGPVGGSRGVAVFLQAFLAASQIPLLPPWFLDKVTLSCGPDANPSLRHEARLTLGGQRGGGRGWQHGRKVGIQGRERCCVRRAIAGPPPPDLLLFQGATEAKIALSPAPSH